MFKNFAVLSLITLFALSSCAQTTVPATTPSSGSPLKDKMNSGDQQQSPSSSQQSNPLAALEHDQIIQGLKEALILSAQKSSNQLSLADGFFKNQVIKILMPPDAKIVEEKLRSLGLGAEVDRTILTMNRAAEDAAKDAAPIFIEAIKAMSIQDATAIVIGANDAATKYLKSTTSAQLTTKFKPVIKNSLDKVDATKYWSDIFTTYNKLPFVKPVNSDLTAYVTQKALDGLFTTMAGYEAQIRKYPAATANDLINQVFGKK